MFDIGVMHFVLVSILLVAAGIAVILTKRNAIGILIGVELVLNAASVNLVAFNRYAHQDKQVVTAAAPVELTEGASVATQAVTVPAIDGNMFAIFIIVLAAAEAAIALAIFLNFYNNFSSIDVERADEMKG